MDFSTKASLLLIFFIDGNAGFGLFGLGIIQLLRPRSAGRLLAMSAAVAGIWATNATALVVLCEMFPPHMTWEHAMHFSAMAVAIGFMLAMACDPAALFSTNPADGED